jgi:hypothetical protein
MRLLLARGAEADTHNLLGAAAQVEALRRALVRPTARLVGEHRSRYDEIGTLELTGMGARRWRTRSGYVGLTVYFWDPVGKAWATWSDTRPTNLAEQFDPARRYLAEGPWLGCSCPGEAARCRLRLMHAWRNPIGRLSGRASTQALITGATDFQTANSFPLITTWSALADQAMTAFGNGFSDGDERVALVLLQPHRWENAVYDDVRQELIRVVRDEGERPLVLSLPFSKETEDAVATLEHWQATPGARLLGLLRLRQGAITVEPFTLFEETKQLNLTLDAPQYPPRLATSGPPASDDDDPADDRSTTTVGRLLATVTAELEVLAECGVRAMRRLDTLADGVARIESLGLTVCATPLATLMRGIDTQRHTPDADPTPVAAHLLSAYYCLRRAATTDLLLASLADWR